MLHLETKSFTSALILGQNSNSLALLKHPFIPICERCISFSISVRSEGGTTKRSPRKTSAFSSISSLRLSWYGISGLGHSLRLDGHPFCIWLVKSCISGSWAVRSLNSSNCLGDTESPSVWCTSRNACTSLLSCWASLAFLVSNVQRIILQCHSYSL